MSGMTDSSTDEPGFRLLTAALVLMLLLQLLRLGGQWNSLALSVVGAIVLAAGFWRVNRHPLAFWTALLLLFLAVGGGWLISEQGSSDVVGSPFRAPFLLFVAASVLRQVLNSKRVTEDTLLGSVCAYILLGLAFGSAYEAVEFFSPGAIAGIDANAAGRVFSTVTYFSFVTLTTLGYGDLYPVHPFCQSLAIVESVVGVLFPSLIVARIIGIQAAEGPRSFSQRESKWTREALVARILFVFLPVAVLVLPWARQTSWGSIVVGGLFWLMVIAGVNFVSGRRVVLVVVVSLAVVAEGLRIVAEDFVVVSVIFEVVLITLIVGRMSLWCFRQRRATTSVILSAACIYWLIGIGFAQVYELVNKLVPGAIVGSGQHPLGKMLYFSFMTLTTTGYGDFTPAIGLTRTLASLEAFVGIFYPSIVIAKLVSLYGVRE